jgi:hypothetical protein
MGWIGLHTSPNIDPHATIAYWRVDNPEQEQDLDHEAEAWVRAHAAIRREMGWRGTYPFIVNDLDMFGAPSDPKEVALLRPAFGYQEQVDDLLALTTTFHYSQWPVNLHVTHHRNRPFFEFKYIAFHTKLRDVYERLAP